LAEGMVHSDGGEASVTPIPSADGYLGFQEDGGHIQLMDYHTTEFLGVYHTQVTGEDYTVGPTDTCPIRHITELYFI